MRDQRSEAYIKYAAVTLVEHNTADDLFILKAKRYEEAGMHGTSEQESEAYIWYDELLSERQHGRPAPQ